MSIQWNLILALIFALIVAIFAVVNVDPVRVDYMFGTSEIPLILIILGSALLGGLIVGSIGLFRNFMLQRKLKQLINEKEQLERQLEELQAGSAENLSKEEAKKTEKTTELT
ncbi:lipopolysaccharide assembly protein LapA domain-containing protein [Mesobacillus maritimus]|uniref:LapA family protein n=1 Tax=Mesobacillus maritimus TaxID=1643336 RepID=UPI002040999F|nr:lipopolysaccharide assembly protein LapA domain-containing protein [Mesobacillus maritimus]